VHSSDPDAACTVLERGTIPAATDPAVARPALKNDRLEI
jgi:hypothetical protein